MNEIIQGMLMIMGGNLMSSAASHKDESLYDEYEYESPFQLPRLNSPVFGNIFVYNKGEFKRKDADVYAEQIIFGIEQLEGIKLIKVNASTGSNVCKMMLKPINNVRRAFNLQRQIKYILNREDARIYNDGSCIVVELPNNIETVRFGDFMHDERFKNERCKTVVPIGQGTDGKIEYADIAKMPHMLVAGTTGSGKSVFLNSIITALLMKNTPDDLQMFLIDPKMVEFKPNYEKLRYVHCVDETRDAIRLLQNLVNEMEHRYAFLARKGCKDIDTYNAKYQNKMPRLVLIVDEMADMIKSDGGKQVEKNMVRIAQKARACGIHMILATQRPTKDVVTGLIKANIPCRVALSVTSKVDSLVILDRVGAENLLGNGDMLFLDGKNNKVAKRLQGGYVEPAEIANVVVGLVRDNQPNDYRAIDWDKVNLSEDEKRKVMI